MDHQPEIDQLEKDIDRRLNRPIEEWRVNRKQVKDWLSQLKGLVGEDAPLYQELSKRNTFLNNKLSSVNSGNDLRPGTGSDSSELAVTTTPESLARKLSDQEDSNSGSTHDRSEAQVDDSQISDLAGRVDSLQRSDSLPAGRPDESYLDDGKPFIQRQTTPPPAHVITPPQSVAQPVNINYQHHNSAQDEKQASDQALTEIKGVYTLGNALQTGRYSSGYQAADKEGQILVAKIPAQGEWLTRFAECKSALAIEADILPRVNKIVGDEPPAGCARVIKHVEKRDIRVDTWPDTIPLIVQSFARGTRLSTPGWLPMRDQREPIALRILLQVTGLTLLLYKNNLAHRDLKVDCLFWDEQAGMVEVIDWNRATTNLSQEDKQFEFEAIQRLTSELLLGRFFKAGEESLTIDLFADFQGLPLSRGTRMLLLRLLHLPSLPNAIRTIDELHAALQELVTFWDTPLDRQPSPVDSSAGAHAQVLNQFSIEYQRDSADSRVITRRTEWYMNAIRAAQRMVQGVLGSRLISSDALRPGMLAIEQTAVWLPDIWPLTWMMPLARAWFLHQHRSTDAQITQIVEHLIYRRWDVLDDMVQRLLPDVPPAVQVPLRRLNTISDAYRKLETIERALAETSPDYASTMELLQQIRITIPLELRVMVIAQQIDIGLRAGSTIARLLGTLADLRSQARSSVIDQEIFTIMKNLYSLGLTHPEFESQKQHVMQNNDLRRKLEAAKQYINSREWQQAVDILEPINFEISPSDLKNQVQTLLKQALEGNAQKTINTQLKELYRRLAVPDFVGAEQIAQEMSSFVDTSQRFLSEDMLNIAPRLPGYVSAVKQECEDLQQSLADSNYSVNQPLSLLIPVPLLAELRQINTYGYQLSEQNNISLTDIQTIQAHAQKLDSHPQTQKLWRVLLDQTIKRVCKKFEDGLGKSDEISNQDLQDAHELLQIFVEPHMQPFSKHIWKIQQQRAQQEQGRRIAEISQLKAQINLLASNAQLQPIIQGLKESIEQIRTGITTIYMKTEDLARHIYDSTQSSENYQYNNLFDFLNATYMWQKRLDEDLETLTEDVKAIKTGIVADLETPTQSIQGDIAKPQNSLPNLPLNTEGNVSDVSEPRPLPEDKPLAPSASDVPNPISIPQSGQGEQSFSGDSPRKSRVWWMVGIVGIVMVLLLVVTIIIVMNPRLLSR